MLFCTKILNLIYKLQNYKKESVGLYKSSKGFTVKNDSIVQTKLIRYIYCIILESEVLQLLFSELPNCQS